MPPADTAASRSIRGQAGASARKALRESANFLYTDGAMTAHPCFGISRR